MPIDRRPAQSFPLVLRKSLIESAEEVGVDIQSFCERALGSEVERLWKEQNRPASEAMNAWVEENGLPLERYRVWPPFKQEEQA